jgi:hypothetical protein
LSSTVPRNTAVDWRNARSMEIPAQSHAYALLGGATMVAKTPSRTAATKASSCPGSLVTVASLGGCRVEGKRPALAHLMVAIKDRLTRVCSTVGIRLEPEELGVEPVLTDEL